MADETPDLFADLPPDEPVVVPAPPEPGREPTIQERFEAFQAANPWVYATLARLARELVAKGQRKIGIGMLIEVIRWDYQRRTTDQHSGFRIDNRYRSRYARALMENEPDLAGVFETRELQTD